MADKKSVDSLTSADLKGKRVLVRAFHGSNTADRDYPLRFELSTVLQGA